MVERVNRFLKASLTKLLDHQAEWKRELGTMQYIINNTYHSTTKASPSKLMLGYDQRNHVDHKIAQLTKSLLDIDVDLESERTTNRESALQASEILRNYNKRYT